MDQPIFPHRSSSPAHLLQFIYSFQARACVFDVTTSPGDLFLVVKLEKVCFAPASTIVTHSFTHPGFAR